MKGELSLIILKLEIVMVELDDPRARQQVTAQMFASKFRSKREV